VNYIYLILFFVLVVASAFFSSAETSVLSLNKIKLKLRAKKKDKKAMFLSKILENPDEFFSTILVGNNFVNIASASISTYLFSKWMSGSDENVILLLSTLITTLIILIFAEIIPKSYAFRYSKKMSYLYTYPIRFFSGLFYPFVKILSFISGFLFRRDQGIERKRLTTEEIKHFLSTEMKLHRYSTETLRMIHEIIDIAGKDIKSIMTPRLDMIAISENAGMDELKKIILEKKVGKIPVYKNNLDNITGFIHARNLTALLLTNHSTDLTIEKISRPPVFLSEYSSLDYALKQFKRNNINMAVILDEYGATIGMVTLHDIFKEILGGIEFRKEPIKRLDKNVYVVNGSLPVDELNSRLHLDLPDSKDYTTLSGMFIYYYGKYPKLKSRIKIKDNVFVVTRMGKRKIEQLKLEREEKE